MMCAPSWMRLGSRSAVLLGVSEGGSLAALFAATYPERCRALVLYGAFAQFSHWFPTKERLDRFFEYVENGWGTGAGLPNWAPSRKHDEAFKRWFARRERLGASPAGVIALMRMNSEINISGILPAIRVPTLVIHRTNDIAVSVEGSRTLAKHIPSARLVEFPGEDHLPYVGENADQIVDEIEEFVTGTRSEFEPERVLATVLFTDIANSTQRAASLGDQAWRTLMERHDSLVREQFSHFRGREIKTLGDGFLATFDGPARAVRCATTITSAAPGLGLQVRAGVHTGEIALKGDDVEGVAVHTASRIINLAEPGRVLASGTVRDLVAGSNLRFEDAGVHTLKGLPEQVRLFWAS